MLKEFQELYLRISSKSWKIGDVQNYVTVGPTPTPSYMSTPTTGGREGRASVKVIAELVDFVACVFKERLSIKKKKKKGEAHRS